MAGNNVKINLLFQADTTAAVANMQQLGKALNDISKNTTIGIDSGAMQKAVQSAQQLQIHLQNAVNVNTGKLDLNKLNTSLKSSGQSLQALTTNLQAVGPTGQQAFIKVATAVASAEAPMVRINKRLKDFGITLANTVKWQIASSAVHSLSGMLSSAVGHAEDLNKALNDIRIVTGYSTATMAQFANRASSAAKELSTTTTEYAKAALIFYQQGLSNTDVDERANVVIKLAQITGESAQTVSDQMTAIWNNFNDGAHSLEYYADALTKLGAATAASTDEISAGLEKFASIAKTVGLSYDTAAAAVATVVDKTRESADVVGTAFKTIFGRMQGLQLGETLEDGVDLNKYSEALESVGVEVLNAEGEVRKMDDILDDLGEKWQGFGESTKIAIAQTVGGMRQYNQMMALMENWDAVEENIELATNATGELSKQQDIWAESYEAAAQRVKQAQNELYESFIDDESIITINNLIADLIGSVGNLINAFGGIGPVLLTVGLLFSKTIIPLIGNGIKSVSNAISVWSGKAAQEVMDMQNQMQAQITSTMNKSGFSEGVRQQLELSRQLIGVKQQLTLSSKSMTMAEQEEASARIQMYEAMVAETQQLLAKKAAMEEELRVLKLKAVTETLRSQKRGVATKTTTEQFRADNTDRDSDEVNDIIEEASTRSLGETRGELQALQEQTATQEQRLLDKKSELVRVRQQIASHEKELEQKLEQNTSSGWDTKDGQHHLQALEDAQKREKELTAEIAEISDEDYSSRVDRLHEVIKLQKEIQKNTDQETEEMSHGKVKSEIFANTLNESGSDVGGYISSMANKAISEIGGEMNAEGGTSVDASITNIEKLFGVIGQYKTQLAEITAVQQDFKAVENEVATAFTEMNNSMKPEEIAAAQQELADANMEVKSKTEALIAAEKKLVQERAKGPKNAKNIAKAQKEVANASAEVQKAQDKLTKTFAKQPETFKKVVTAQKAILDSEDKYMELAKAAGASEEEIKQLASAFEKFKKSGNPADLKTLISTLTNMKIASLDTISGLDGLANEMRDMMVAAGMSPDKIDPIINKLRELSNQAPQVQTGLRGVGAEGEALGVKFSISATSISSALASIATAAGQLSMGISGINAFVNAFDEGNTPMETFMGILTGITMIAPVISGLFKKIADAKKKDTAETIANTVATIANTTAESGSTIAKGAKTAATWLLNAALATQKILENPVTGAIIVGVALAAAAAIAVKTKAVEKQNEELRKNNEENMKNAESTNDLSAAWAEQMNTMDNLIAKYRKLDQAGKDYQQTVEDIINAVPDLIDAYSQLAEGLDLTAAGQEEFNQYIREMKEAAAVGDVETIAEAQVKMDNLLSPKAAEEAKNGANAAMNLAAQAMAEEGGAKFKDNKVTRHVGGTSTKTVYDENGNRLGGEEQVSVDILNKHGVGTKTGARGFDVELNASDSGKFLEDYEALMAAAEEMESTLGEHLDNSDTYREIKEMLDASKEQYEKLAEMQAEAEKYGVLDAKTNIEKSKEEGGLGYGIEDIDSLKKYEEYRQAMIDNTAGEDATAEEIAQAEAAVDAWLEAQDAVQEYTDAKHKLGYISTQAGKAAEEAAKAAGKSDEEAAAAAEKARAARQAELETFFDTLDADQQKFLLEVDFSKYQSEEAITAEITRLQNIADQDAIKIKIEAINIAQSSLKESGMTEEDWIAIRDSGIEWGKEGVIQFTEFLTMSYEEQSKYLERIQADQNEVLENIKESTLANLYQDLQNLPTNTDNYNVEYEAIQNNIQALEEELSILEKVNLAKELKDYEIDIDEYEDVADAFREMADAGVEGMDALKNDEEAVKDATVRYMRLNEAIEDIYDNYDDYTDVLKDVRNATSRADRAMAANTNSAKKLKTSMAGLLGTTEDMIDADFLATIDPDDFKAAANGNADAIERIRNQFIDLQAQMYECESEADAFKQRLAELPDGAYIDLNTDPFLNALIQAAVQAGATATDIENMLSGFGIDADVTPFTEELWQATQNARAAGQDIADATSFTTEVETADVDASSEVELPQYQEVASAQTRVMGYNQVPLGNGFTAAIFPSVITTTSKRVDTSTVPQTIEKTETAVGQSVTTGDGNTSKGGVIVKNAHKATTASKTPSASNTSRPPVGSKSSGGGSNPKAPSKIDKRDTTQKSDVVQRYREIDDSIDNVTDALTRAEQAASRLWGKDKINAMKEENKLLKQQYKLIQDKAEQAKKYAEEDYAELMRTASEAGISLVVDRATGDITNIEDGLDTLYDRLESAEKEYNKKVEEYNNAVLAATKSDGTVSESDSQRLEAMKDAIDAYEDDIIDGIEDDIEAVQNAEEQFQESVETWEQAGLDMESILDSIMQNNYDIIMEGLEIPLSLNEEDLRYIELRLSQIEDDMYSMSEAVALTSSELSEYKDNLRLADEALAELNRAHETGEITDAAYQEGLGEIRDKYYENVESLMELDKTMKEYYSNTLDMANEELSKYTEQMEHQTSVLEHYQSLIELMGKSTDYKMIGKILEGQVETTKNSMEVSKQWYETQRNNADALAAEYAAALANNASEAELEIIKANWEAAEASANEAQDQMLSDAEAWAEALKAVLENELADLSQTLENALTGGTSFDTLTTQMERAASLQEEYLTTTNQIYETNKLMRTAQQEIDKTTNAVAKKKLKAYINETEQLQNQSKLSQYELEIQQAKYNLLLAEIALQEAQDAKSTVRLQRDSEGNFGYVYTADSNKINEAQQKLEDAQNDLYNKGLDGANDYAQKYQQTMQEMYDTLADIQQRHLDGEYETEAEYHAAMEEAKAYYYQKLQDYSSLYSVAVTADSRVVADAWSTDFASMIYDTDNWKQAVEDYTDDAIAAFTKWQNAVTGEGGIADLIGNSVEDVGKTVQEVTDKSKELAKKTQEEVIPALDKELDSVNNLTGAYAKMRDTIKETIEYYTNMINRINNSQTSDWNSGSEGSDDSSIPEDGGSGNGGGNSDAIPGGQDDGQGEGSPDTIPGGSPDGEGGSGISYHSGTLKFSGSGANRVWTDASGKTYAYGSPEQKAFQKAFDKAYGRNGGYKGDYWIGWSGDGGKLNADVLHEKYGLATGGYTGDWAGSYGKLAFLHQKELVLNAQDTENFLASMEVMERILQVIDMQSANAQLGGILSSPGFNSNNSQVIEQSVHIEASFPGVQDRSEIEEAFNNLINKASQYANRK